MIRAIIIDDHADSRNNLTEDIRHTGREISIVGYGTSVSTGIKAILQFKPDLVFLDIHLEDGNGFQVLEGISNYNFKVIFTTGSGDFALKAIKFSAVDYLLKPIDPDDLDAAIGKMEATMRAGSDFSNQVTIQALIENLGALNKAPKRVALSSADRIHMVALKDIIHCESQSNYTLFHLQDNKKILVTRTLKEFEDMFENDGFIRVHHSHLINLDHLKEFIKADGGYALMVNQSKVPVAVRKKDGLLKRLGVH